MGRDKELIIHIGIHKTGSTAIQHFFWRHDVECRERGVLYPRAGRPADETIGFGHHDIPWALDGSDTAPADTLDRLRTEIESSPLTTVLLSSEEFDRLGDAEVAALRRALPWPARIVMYYRRQSEVLQGMYGTMAASFGDLRPIAEFALSPGVSLDIHALARRWAGTFGERAVVALPYRRKSFPDGNIVPHFLAAAGLDDLPVPAGEEFDYNPSLPWYAVAAVQRLWAAGVPPERLWRATAALGLIGRGRTDRNPFMPPSEAHAFDLGFVESNAAFQAEFAPGDPPLLPASPDGDEAWHEERAGPEAALERLFAALADYVEVAEFNAAQLAQRAP